MPWSGRGRRWHGGKDAGTRSWTAIGGLGELAFPRIGSPLWPSVLSHPLFWKLSSFCVQRHQVLPLPATISTKSCCLLPLHKIYPSHQALWSSNRGSQLPGGVTWGRFCTEACAPSRLIRVSGPMALNSADFAPWDIW